MSSVDNYILIVDDNETNLNLLTRYLLRSGDYNVTSAQSGAEAIHLINTQNFDLVLLDLIMPNISGIDVLKTIRKKYSLQELPVIILTAKDEKEAAVETFQEGANDYVVKPVDVKILKARADTQIKLKRNTQAYEGIQKKLESLVEERTIKLDKLNKTLDKERRFFEYLLGASPSVIYVCDMDNQYTCSYVSQNLTDITGHNPEQMISSNTFWKDHVHPDDIRKTIIRIGRNLKSGNGAVEYRFRHKNGKYRWIYDQQRIINEDGRAIQVIGSWTDFTEVKKLREEIQYKTSFNDLTGLINRGEFERRLQQLMEEATAETGQHVICYMDMDQFKVINNTYGHFAGDQLLKKFSNELADVFSKRDLLGYLGGDEFGILLPHCTINQAMSVLENVREFVNEFRFIWQGKKLSITVSIGVVPINKHTGTSTDILSYADSACFAAKEAGRDRIHVYSSDDLLMSKRHKEMQWVEYINTALEEDRLFLYYQSIIPLHPEISDRHFELLVRMKDKSGKLILPGEFLPAAERYNISSKIDYWVIQTFFSWLEVYDELVDKDFRWGINLSGQSLSDRDLLQFVIGELNRRDIPPEKVYFEITETSAIANFSNAVEFVNTLKKYGCRFALDDFGSGLSSFAYLKNIAVDFLKIDGIFVKNMNNNDFDFSIVKAVNEVAHVLGIRTIAEYVENQEILDKLKSVNVDYAQGYLIDKPSPFDEAYSARRDAQYTIKDNFGMWVNLDDDKKNRNWCE